MNTITNWKQHGRCCLPATSGRSTIATRSWVSRRSGSLTHFGIWVVFNRKHMMIHVTPRSWGLETYVVRPAVKVCRSFGPQELYHPAVHLSANREGYTAARQRVWHGQHSQASIKHKPTIIGGSPGIFGAFFFFFWLKMVAMIAVRTLERWLHSLSTRSVRFTFPETLDWRLDRLRGAMKLATSQPGKMTSPFSTAGGKKTRLNKESLRFS